jgi:hypothetical protein
MWEPRRPVRGIALPYIIFECRAVMQSSCRFIWRVAVPDRIVSCMAVYYTAIVLPTCNLFISGKNWWSTFVWYDTGSEMKGITSECEYVNVWVSVAVLYYIKWRGDTYDCVMDWNDFEGSGHSVIEVLSWHLFRGRNWGNLRNIWVLIARVPVEPRNEKLQNVLPVLQLVQWHMNLMSR